MSKSVQGMIQTIATLKQLQLAEQAQTLAREQFGVGQQNQQNQSLMGFQNLLQGSANPTQLESIIPQFAGARTGLDESALSTIAQNTMPQAAHGAQKLPGEIAEDNLKRLLYSHTTQYLNELSPEERQPIVASTLQHVASGQDVGSAASSAAMADFFQRAPKELRDQIIAIGKGLAPSASDDAQLRLGWAKYRADVQQATASLANDTLRTQAALQTAAKTLDAQAFKTANDLVDQRAHLLENMTKSSATATAEGIRTNAEQLNAFNEQLRQAAPGIFGKGGTHPLTDLKPDQTTNATGLLPFLSNYLTGR